MTDLQLFMTKLSNLFCCIVLLFAAHVRGAAFLEGGGGGGAPNVVTISPGTDLSQVSWQNDTAYQLGDGGYRVGTPSIILSNFLVGTSYGGTLLANKTNVTIQGVRGQTKIYATNGVGEGLFISNCSGINLIDVDYIAYTNFNRNQMPGYSPITTNQGAYLWANIAFYRSENLLFKGLYMFGGGDHGVADNAYNNGTLFPISDIKSTNNIVFEDCTFMYQGGFRTNSASGGATSYSLDGASIICTSARIRRCHFESTLRGIEIYDEADAGGGVFAEIEITDCTFKNTLSFAIGMAGSTNGHHGLIANCRLYNDRTFSIYGTNWGGASQPDFNTFTSYGLDLSGGRGWRIANTDISGLRTAGVFLGNGNSFCDDFTFNNIYIHDIIDGQSGTGVGLQIGITTDTAAMASSARRARFSNITLKNIAAKGARFTACRDCVVDGITLIDAGLYNTASSESFAALSLGESSFSANTLTNFTLRNVWGSGVSAYGIVAASGTVNALVENWTLTGYGENGGVTNKAGANVTFAGASKTFYATIDLPSIGVNSQFTTNFTASGVTTNFSVETLRIPAQFYASGNTTNVIYTAWCSNDLVYVKFSNNDAVTAADAPSVRMAATVRQVQIPGQ